MKDFWKQYGNRIILVGLVLLALGIYALVRYLIKVATVPNDTKLKDPLIGKDEQLKDWDYDALLNEVILVLDTSYYIDGSARCEAYKQLAELTDNQLITVANAYKNKKKQTIRQAMETTWADGCTMYASAWGDILRNRMRDLNIP